MTKVLAELLSAKQPLFSIALDQLEEVSAKPSVDVKLQVEIGSKFKKAVKSLGLDPSDSTGPEIYHALIEQVKRHDLHLAKRIGADKPYVAATVLAPVKAAIEATHMTRRCFALKLDVARQLLRKQPPKNVMKLLGHETVDELLSSEDLLEVYSALRFAESDEWLRDFNQQYKTIKGSDFEERDIKLIVMDKRRWGEVAHKFVLKKRHLNTHLKELGVVVILPPVETSMPGIVTKLLSLTYHYYNEIRLYSAFFKLQRHKQNFGEILTDTLIADTGKSAVVAGTEIHWRVIQRYFGKLKDEYHPEIFEPHVQPEDLHWRHAEEMLYEIDSEFDFWRGLDYVGTMYDGRPISLNLVDVVLSFSNAIAYDERYIYHFRESLWNEIFARYMGNEALREQILRQLDNDIIAPEQIK